MMKNLILFAAIFVSTSLWADEHPTLPDRTLYSCKLDCAYYHTSNDGPLYEIRARLPVIRTYASGFCVTNVGDAIIRAKSWAKKDDDCPTGDSNSEYTIKLSDPVCENTGSVCGKSDGESKVTEDTLKTSIKTKKIERAKKTGSPSIQSK